MISRGGVAGSPNRALVLHTIRDHGPLSRAEIARRLNLSRPTASRIVGALQDDGLIVRTGKSHPTGGRLGELYSLRTDGGFVLGMDLGTRQAHLALAQLDGTLIRRVACPVPLDNPHTALRQLSETVHRMLQDLPGAQTTLHAIGLAVPGVVHLRSGYVGNATFFSSGLSERPLQKELEHRLHTPVIMDNDVNLAAWGECQFGCAQGVRNVVYIFVGRGIGAGLVLDGRLFRGSSETAGELGYMIVDRAGLYQDLGARGYLETVAGIDRLVRGAQALGLATPTPEALCEAAFAGDARAGEIVREVGEYLAAAIINVATVLDPDMIVLGGDLADLPHVDDLFVQPIDGMIRKHLLGSCRLCLSALRSDAALRGAVQAALDWTLDVTGTALSSIPPLPSAAPSGSGGPDSVLPVA